jgi:hypothetical protein
VKIGIMTYWWSDDNYGQILQCYALQKYLRDAGHDAYLIRYNPDNDYIKTTLLEKVIKSFNPVKLFRFFRIKLTKKIIKKLNEQRKFEEFKNNFINYSKQIYLSFKELVEYPPKADIYIAGSDQIWNTFSMSITRSKDVLRAYFLDFGDSLIKRVAYAASFGKDKLSDDFKQEASPFLQHFDYISVREKSGLEICRQCGFDRAVWAPDPTMLLDADVYRSLYNSNPINKPKKSYCLLYMLSNKTVLSVRKVFLWAKRNNIEIVYITGNARYDKYQKYYATIPEWLYLIDHARYVITNSYHCTIFSLLFQKQFGIVPLAGRHKAMNSRFVSLWEIFRIGARYVTDDFTVLDELINWNLIHDVFVKNRRAYGLLDIIGQ